MVTPRLISRKVPEFFIYQAEAPFDEAKDSLPKKGINAPINVWDEAYARIVLGKSHYICENGCYTAQGFVHAKGELPLLPIVSPLLDSELAKKAVEANRNNKYFCTKDLQTYEKKRKIADQEVKSGVEPEKRSVLILPSRDNFAISHTEHPDIYNGIFHRGILGEKVAKKEIPDYLDFTGYNSLLVRPADKNVIDSQNGTLITELWLYRLGDGGRSGLDGDNWGLYYNFRVRGVLMKTAEGGSQKTSRVLPSTKKDIQRELKRISRLEKEIQQSRKFFERLIK